MKQRWQHEKRSNRCYIWIERRTVSVIVCAADGYLARNYTNSPNDRLGSLGHLLCLV